MDLKTLISQNESEILEFKERFDFEEYQGFRVVFMKDIYSEEYLRDLSLNERQIRAVMYLKEKGKITNKDYQVLNKISRETSKIELNTLVDKKIIVKIGKGRGVHYHLG